MISGRGVVFAAPLARARPSAPLTPAFPHAQYFVVPPSSFHLARLRTGVKPFRLHFFPRLRSTSDHAAALRKRGELFAPAIVLTSHQIAGRGRGTNTWWSGPGCLTVTFVMPVEEHLQMHQIPLIAGLAIRDAAAELVGRDDLELKWPNDLLFNGRKLAGLLCERIHKADLIGLGLNVNLNPRKAPAALRDQITSLAELAGKPLDMNEALAAVSRHLHRALSRRGEKPFAQTLERYESYHALTGKRVTVVGADGEKPVSGEVQGLDSHGRLLLRSKTGLHHIIAGQIHAR
jgi:BirA family biotin operon repressor/biotin-[acetyl-CoA-carboxylase] ligase